MQLKLLPLIFLLPIAISISAADFNNVKKIKEQDDGTFNVKCVNKNSGIISFEDENICIFLKNKHNKRCEDELDANELDNSCQFSSQNLTNYCQEEYTWSVDEAAEMLCQN